MDDDEHYAINRAWWDERAQAHASSPDYAVAELIADPTRLSDVVRFDLPRLGDINGQRGIHLQCHIGTDTISLHRLGATMTGLDFSSESIAIARGIAADAGAMSRLSRRTCTAFFLSSTVDSTLSSLESEHSGGYPISGDGQRPSRIYFVRVAGSSCARDIQC